MDIPTTLYEIGGTLMIRIPREMVTELKLNKEMKANMVDVNNSLIEVRFNRG